MSTVFSPDPRRSQVLLETFRREFGGADVIWCSAPGRTELGGNHTDHQGGHVLVAAVDRDMLGCAAPNGGDTIRVLSEGHASFAVTLRSGQRQAPGTSAALVQGIAVQLQERGYPIGGTDICMDSLVPSGSGLSSSAAFEVLIAQMLNTLYCGGALDGMTLAQIARQAENRWFGKPCGLMDQAACALGGVTALDLGCEPPSVRRLPPPDLGCDLCIISVGADHADLTDAYAAIPAEMGAVAAYFGRDLLRQVPEEVFWNALPQVRLACGDRAAVRAAHFFAEDRRAAQQAEALARNDGEGFLELVRQSGRSSAMYLQNIYAESSRQTITAALAAAEHLLAGRGAVRVHGGGFAGTVQAWVPRDMTEAFCRRMDALSGPCYVAQLRNDGAVCCNCHF